MNYSVLKNSGKIVGFDFKKFLATFYWVDGKLQFFELGIGLQEMAFHSGIVGIPPFLHALNFCLLNWNPSFPSCDNSTYFVTKIVLVICKIFEFTFKQWKFRTIFGNRFLINTYFVWQICNKVTMTVSSYFDFCWITLYLFSFVQTKRIEVELKE